MSVSYCREHINLFRNSKNINNEARKKNWDLLKIYKLIFYPRKKKDCESKIVVKMVYLSGDRKGAKY